eukprot:SAG31_NODE_3109_length_4665_cov_2.150022_5_plen_87_part_00
MSKGMVVESMDYSAISDGAKTIKTGATVARKDLVDSLQDIKESVGAPLPKIKASHSVGETVSMSNDFADKPKKKAQAGVKVKNPML